MPTRTASIVGTAAKAMVRIWLLSICKLYFTRLVSESFWREPALMYSEALFEFADLLRHHARKRHMTEDHALGRRGEDLAHRLLQRAGMVVVDRNYRMASGAGEVDLVGWEGDTLVFVEVKSRQTDEYGSPDRAIGPEKHASLIRPRASTRGTPKSLGESSIRRRKRRVFDAACGDALSGCLSFARP